MKKDSGLIPTEIIERKIYLIRGVKVMLDSDLAQLYQVQTKALIQAVKRNLKRFPLDFMFQLSAQETSRMRSQIVTASKRNVRYQPYVFTEHGVSMLSAILKSKKAVDLSLAIIRAFIKLRELMATHKNIVSEIEKIKRGQKDQDQKIQSIIHVISQMLNPPIDENRAPIGFRDRKSDKK